MKSSTLIFARWEYVAQRAAEWQVSMMKVVTISSRREMVAGRDWGWSPKAERKPSTVGDCVSYVSCGRVRGGIVRRAVGE